MKSFQLSIMNNLKVSKESMVVLLCKGKESLKKLKCVCLTIRFIEMN